MPIVALFKGLHSPNQARSQLSSPYEVSIRVYRLKVAPGQVDSVPLVECQSVYKLRQTQVKLSLGWISLQPRPSPRGNEAAAAASFPLGLNGLGQAGPSDWMANWNRNIDQMFDVRNVAYNFIFIFYPIFQIN